MSPLTMTAPASRYTGWRDFAGPTNGSQSSAATHHREAPVTADITSLLASAEQGDRAAADAVFAALYEELHRMARRELARRGSGVTLGATTLLHDAYLDISGREGTAFPDRNRFMGYASRVMRNIIIDYARRHQAQKRGGLFEITSLQDGPRRGRRRRRAVEHQRSARRAGGGRRPAGPDRRPEVLLRLLVSSRSPACWGCPSAPSSATGRRPASTCTSGCDRSRTGVMASSFDSARWVRASRYLDRVLDLPAGEREACVAALRRRGSGHRHRRRGAAGAASPAECGGLPRNRRPDHAARGVARRRHGRRLHAEVTRSARAAWAACGWRSAATAATKGTSR